MGTVDSFLCDRLGAGFATDPVDRLAHPAAAIDTPELRPSAAARSSACPRDVLPEIRDTAGDLGTLRHRRWPVELPLRGQVRRPAGGAGRRGLRRARPGEGDLRHRRVRARPRRRASARAGAAACCRPSPGASTARSSTRSTAASSPPGRCSSGCAASSASPTTRPRSASWRARPRPRPAPGCCPALAGHRRAVVAAERARRDRRDLRRDHPRATSPARRSRGSPGGWPTWSPRSARRVAGRGAARRRRPHQRAAAARSCRPTRSACRSRRRGADATVLGAAALGRRRRGRDRLADGPARDAARGPPGGAGARRGVARRRARALARVRVGGGTDPR